MVLDDIIKEINALNNEVIRLSVPETYEKALSLSEKQIQLCTNAIPSEVRLNSDYLSLALVNKAFLMRRYKGDEKSALELIAEAKDAAKDNTTSFGKARVLEEEALTIRYFASNSENPNDERIKAINLTRKAVLLYEAALRNSNEIVNKDIIKNKIYRNIGIVAATASDIYVSTDDQILKDESQKLSIDYAKEELKKRKENRETKGHDLMNAYHTLGVALTTASENNDKVYKQAKSALNKARILNEDSLVDTVLDYEMAMLEFIHNKEHKENIGSYMVSFFEKSSILTMDLGVKKILKNNVILLSSYLGGDFEKHARQLYQ